MSELTCGNMSKRGNSDDDYKCPNQGCKKKFKHDGMNDKNYQRHLDSWKKSN